MKTINQMPSKWQQRAFAVFKIADNRGMFVSREGLTAQSSQQVLDFAYPGNPKISDEVHCSGD